MYEQPEYGYPEDSKQTIEPLREVLNRAVISLGEEIEMLTNRIAPVLRLNEPRLASDIGPDVPHSSEIAANVYELHRLASRIAELSHRVEL